jgi:peptidoglycan/LPS O-acetylase OafA/YrhL
MNWLLPNQCHDKQGIDAALAAPRNPRYQTLDLWRGVACLMIVALHAVHHAGEMRETAGAFGKGIYAILSRLGIGVPIFFVISGYCIAATSDSTRRKPLAPVSFFYRRFRRIFPPYWCLVLLSIVLVAVLSAVRQDDLVSDEYGYIPNPSTLSWSQYLGNITLTETWRPLLFGGPELKIVGPSWTLCYEEQFYAICGLLLILVPRFFFSGIAVVTLLTLMVAPLGILRPDLYPIQGFFFDGRWLMFAEGVAVYYILNYARSRKAGIGLMAILLAALVACRFGWQSMPTAGVTRDRLFELIGSTGFSLIILLLHSWDARTSNVRLLHPIALCGQMCYSLYLVHWPITVVMTNVFYRGGVCGFWSTLLLVAPLTIAASISASWLFHVTIERRFINGPQRPKENLTCRNEATTNAGALPLPNHQDVLAAMAGSTGT